MVADEMAALRSNRDVLIASFNKIVTDVARSKLLSSSWQPTVATVLEFVPAGIAGHVLVEGVAYPVVVELPEVCGLRYMVSQLEKALEDVYVLARGLHA